MEEFVHYEGHEATFFRNNFEEIEGRLYVDLIIREGSNYPFVKTVRFDEIIFPNPERKKSTLEKIEKIKGEREKIKMEKQKKFLREYTKLISKDFFPCSN